MKHEDTFFTGSYFYPLKDCPGIKYAFEIAHYPLEDGENVYVGMNVEFKEGQQTIQADYTIAVPSADFSTNVSQSFDEVDTKFTKCFSHDDLLSKTENYITNGFLTLVFKGIIKVQQRQVTPTTVINPPSVPQNNDITYMPKNDLIIIIECRNIHVSFIYIFLSIHSCYTYRFTNRLFKRNSQNWMLIQFLKVMNCQSKTLIL